MLTAEVIPPASCDPADLLRKAEPLRGLADAVNVTDAAGARVHMGAVSAAAILARAGIEPILQLTCRDRNRIALQGDLLGAAAQGVRNLLLLAGDQPSAGDQPDAKPVFDLDSAGLIATASRLRDRGELPTGRKVAGAAAFFVGAADLPLDPPAGWRPEGLKRKLAAGAQFAQTQFCMDASLLRRYVARLADEGIVPGLALLVGVSPLRSARSAQWMRQHLYGTVIPDAFVTHLERAADPAAEGRKLCADLIAELATIPGIAGAHVMAPGNEAAAPQLLQDLKARGALRRA
ncbi:MAG: methylenetetrahydrofolate reductase [Variibacter sp.]|nr:methylenetetrahydrofolate reductase [Variibacter sp.]